jgi:hypothetical protein
MRKPILLTMLFCLLFLSACGNNTPSVDAAGQAVQQYFQAKVAGDLPKVKTLLCKEKEAEAEIEAMSFIDLKAKLIDAVCKKNDNADTVTCTGSIEAEYNSGPTSFPLVTYRVVQEDGAWKWCGEATP